MINIDTLEQIIADFEGNVHSTEFAKELAKHIEGNLAVKTLRDEFAMAALQGMLSSGYQHSIEMVAVLANGNHAKGLALASYGFAGAMLEARMEKP